MTAIDTILADRVKQTSTSTGTGSFTLLSTDTPPVGYRLFYTAFGVSASIPYVIDNGIEWEVGYGTYTGNATTGTLTRNPITSSNANALVSFSAGTKTVFCAPSAAMMGLLGIANQTGNSGVPGLAPSASIDSSLGYTIGSLLRSSGLWACRNNAVGAAKWVQVTAIQPFTRMATTTPDATPFDMPATETILDAGIILASGSARAFSGLITAYTASGTTKAWKVEGVVKNVAGTYSFVGTPTVTVLGADTGASTWTLTVQASATGDGYTYGLFFQVTGQAATSINWNAHVFMSDN